MKKTILIFTVLLIGLYWGYSGDLSDPAKSTRMSPADQDKIIENAFRHQANNLQVEGRGVVTRLLADDQKGSRHQKFLIRLSSGQSLLIAHNIDLAPRVKALQKGDTVDFYGEYEFSSKGGLIHWTHHDPKGRHAGGWIKHKGRTYQ